MKGWIFGVMMMCVLNCDDVVVMKFVFVVGVVDVLCMVMFGLNELM